MCDCPDPGEAAPPCGAASDAFMDCVSGMPVYQYVNRGCAQNFSLTESMWGARIAQHQGSTRPPSAIPGQSLPKVIEGLCEMQAQECAEETALRATRAVEVDALEHDFIEPNTIEFQTRARRTSLFQR